MELITTYICKKGDEGVHGNMFGGTLLALIDDAAASYASQICDTQKIVTLKIDELISLIIQLSDIHQIVNIISFCC